MLRQAVRTVLADAGGRQPSHEAWGLVLVAAGVDATSATALPARLGYVFHLGRWTEGDVVTQLEAWGDALRVRAEPDVAAVVDRAASTLREQVAADPEPAAAPAPAPTTAPAPPPAPAPAPGPPPAAGPPPPLRRPDPREQGQQRQHGQQGQQPPWPAPPPAPQSAPPPAPPPGPPRRAPAPSGGSYVPTAGRGRGARAATPAQRGTVVPRGSRPRRNRLVPIVAVAFVVLLCGCSLIGVVGELLTGSG